MSQSEARVRAGTNACSSGYAGGGLTAKFDAIGIATLGSFLHLIVAVFDRGDSPAFAEGLWEFTTLIFELRSIPQWILLLV